MPIQPQGRKVTVSAASNLEVIFNSQLAMSAHISAVCRTGFFQLRQLRTICPSVANAGFDTCSCPGICELSPGLM